MLTIAGFHVPVMLLLDTVGSVGTEDPVQTGPKISNVGVILALTVTVNVVVVAHWPAAGVNV